MGGCIDDLSECMKKNNIKPSYSRIKILDYLVTKRSHPTVDEIHQELVKELPTLSKSTVYNTLNLFIKEKLARILTIEDNETRYDATVENHGHFKCEECGNIYDFIINIDAVETMGLQRFKVHEKNVYFKGLCKSCLTN